MHLTDRQIEILAHLMDDQGHPLWEISQTLGYDEGYLSKKIKEMKDWRLIYHAEAKSSRYRTRSPNMPEKRLFINKEYNILLEIREQVVNRIEHHKPLAERDRHFGLQNSYGENIPTQHQILRNTFEMFSRWLDETIQEARAARRDRVKRLDPCPLTLAEMQALLWDY